MSGLDGGKKRLHAGDIMTKKPFTPNLQELALVRWILASPEKRFAMFYNDPGTVILYERDKLRDEDGRWTVRRIHYANPRPEDDATIESFGGKLKMDPYGLRNAGLMLTSPVATNFDHERKRFNEYTADIWIEGKWPYNAVLGTLTADAADWWEKSGKARYEKLIAKKQQKKEEAAANERVGVFGAEMAYRGKSYSGIHADAVGRVREIIGMASGVVPKWRGMRPAFSAVITRETDTRYYIREEQKLTDAYLPTQGGHGRNVERFIEKDYLILDHATEADIERLKAFDAGIEQDYAGMRDALVDNMVPVMLAALERTTQKSAEIDETFKELIASLRKPE
ncbi:hypothetical protein D3C71_301080 [compost metagenome]